MAEHAGGVPDNVRDDALANAVRPSPELIANLDRAFAGDPVMRDVAMVATE